ncbi:hypothetical protein I4U23_012976 [Adineta vaga]|nr:hypothetical protein I4U23_012976 [Adineta vaga]
MHSIYYIFLLIISSINVVFLKNIQEINCNQYGSDYNTTLAFPFHLPVKPALYKSLKTYAKSTNNQYIYEIRIANQNCIPSIIFCFKHLKNLYLQNTTFCDSKQPFTFHIEYLPSSLVHLQIVDMNFKHLSKEINKFKHLKTLEFSHVPLTTLPITITDLSSLFLLSVSNSSLQSLPKHFHNIRSLTELTLHDNRYLRSIESIDRNPSLELLHIKNCPINRLPLYLPKLYHLDISRTNLTNLSGIETLGQETTKSKTFQLDENLIRSIPPSIGLITNLSRLQLRSNQLDDIPEALYDIKTLKYINLKKNKFSSTNKETIKNEFKTANPKLKVDI